MTLGIDVSEHNSPQPWLAHVAQGVGFAGVRVSHGGALDVAAEGHLGGARHAGVESLLAYHYVTDATPELQAAAFLGAVAREEALLGCELALAIDIEDMLAPHAPWDRPKYKAIGRRIIEFVSEAKGRPVGVYLSSWFAHELQLDAWWAVCPLWLADWQAPYPVPAPWTEATILQYGADGKIDRDRIDSAEVFRAAFGLGMWAAPPAVLGQVAKTSDATAGRCSSAPEDFCQRNEEPPRD